MPQHGPSNAPPTPPSFPAPLLCLFSAPGDRGPSPNSSPEVPHLADTRVPTPPLPSPYLLTCALPLLPPRQDREAERLLRGLQSESREGRREALRHLLLLAPDLTFAREVISRDGLQRLGTIIEDGDE